MPRQEEGHVLPGISYSDCGFSPVEGEIVSVFASYFDESGTHNKRFLVVAGYTAEVDRWAEFSVRWNALLKENGISHLHMKAFRQKASKPFAHLSEDGKQRLLSSLLQTIKDTALFGSFGIIRPQYYEAATTPKLRSMYGSAYAVCASGLAAGSVARVQEMRPGNHRVGMFFEQGHKNVMQALDLIRFRKSELEEIKITGFSRFATIGGASHHLHPPNDPLRINTAKIGAIGIGSRLGMPPLQAADILAYCVYSALVARELEFCKYVIDTIDETVPHYALHLSPELITQLVTGAQKADAEWKQFTTDANHLSKDAKAIGLDLVRVGDAIGFKDTTPRIPVPDEMRARFLRLLGVPPENDGIMEP